METCLYHRGHSFLLSKPLFHGLGFIEILCGSPMRSELPTTFINDSASPDLILRGTTTPTNILSEPILRFRFSKPISRLYRPPLSISARVYYVYGKNSEYPRLTPVKTRIFLIISRAKVIIRFLVARIQTFQFSQTFSIKILSPIFYDLETKRSMDYYSRNCHNEMNI